MISVIPLMKAASISALWKPKVSFGEWGLLAILKANNVIPIAEKSIKRWNESAISAKLLLSIPPVIWNTNVEMETRKIIFSFLWIKLWSFLNSFNLIIFLHKHVAIIVVVKQYGQ